MNGTAAKRRVIYSHLARKDIHNIFDYIKGDSPRAAREFLNEIDDAVSRIAVFPLSVALSQDKILRRKGYRVLVLGSYLIFFVVKGRNVRIRRILHGRRKYFFSLNL